MCYKSILPTTLNPQQMDESCLKLVYLFNRWAKNLHEYGKLDETTLSSDLTFISKLKDGNILTDDLRKTVLLCRDYALGGNKRNEELATQLRFTLNLLCDNLDHASIKELKHDRSDIGMTEYFKPLSIRLRKEKIRKIGKPLKYIDRETDDPKSIKLASRIVEKRAAQNVYKLWKNRNSETNWYRQKIRRAKSFNLFNMSFAEYRPEERSSGTHWALSYDCKGRRSLKKKRSFDSLKEAEMASKNYNEAHPEQEYPMTAYQCAHCGKFHMGHDRYFQPEELKQII